VRLVTYSRTGHRRLGALVDNAVVDLPDAVGHPAFPTTMEALVEAGPGGVEVAREALERPGAIARHTVVAADLLAPILPASLRSFRGWGPGTAEPDRGHPPYSTRNHRAILGPGDDLVWPSFTRELDYELAVACVVGGHGRDLDREHAGPLVFGYTLMNDWCAQDVARGEIGCGVGPAKAKDFATSLGPCIATADEVDPADLPLEARVDGETWSKGNLGAADWTFADMIARLSEGEEVLPGDVVGSGTFAGGSGADLGRSLRPGMVVELETEPIGVLRTAIREATASWPGGPSGH
jgi:2-keto-4-pentenoate hydratase/2-oxohepta-3-ene-1,7-dioic acid hydratase in catechol pathway